MCWFVLLHSCPCIRSSQLMCGMYVCMITWPYPCGAACGSLLWPVLQPAVAGAAACSGRCGSLYRPVRQPVVAGAAAFKSHPSAAAAGPASDMPRPQHMCDSATPTRFGRRTHCTDKIQQVHRAVSHAYRGGCNCGRQRDGNGQRQRVRHQHRQHRQLHTSAGTVNGLSPWICQAPPATSAMTAGMPASTAERAPQSATPLPLQSPLLARTCCSRVPCIGTTACHKQHMHAAFVAKAPCAVPTHAASLRLPCLQKHSTCPPAKPPYPVVHHTDKAMTHVSRHVEHQTR